MLWEYDSLVEERLATSLSGMFGVLALVLSCVGLYGLMAYTVSRRTVGIGVRMALGAERGEIARMVIGETMLLVAVGLAIGVPAALCASRLIASQLFGLKPGDPMTIIGACALMAAVTVLAAGTASSVSESDPGAEERVSPSVARRIHLSQRSAYGTKMDGFSTYQIFRSPYNTHKS